MEDPREGRLGLGIRIKAVSFGQRDDIALVKSDLDSVK
jgi:hypothetical protein